MAGMPALHKNKVRHRKMRDFYLGGSSGMEYNQHH
jgi:hypothetical protein